MASSVKQKYTGILQPDNIEMEKPHLTREGLLEEVICTARDKQLVIIGDSPATGKSLLLELLKCKAEGFDDKVVSHNIVNTHDASSDTFDLLASHGITPNRSETIKEFNK